MAVKFPSLISNVRQILKHHSQFQTKYQQGVPKGHLAIYVGASERKRYAVPLSYLSHRSFQDLLKRAEEEFGFNHRMGCLTIPCKEEVFINLTCQQLHMTSEEQCLGTRVKDPAEFWYEHSDVRTKVGFLDLLDSQGCNCTYIYQ